MAIAAYMVRDLGAAVGASAGAAAGGESSFRARDWEEACTASGEWAMRAPCSVSAGCMASSPTSWTEASTVRTTSQVASLAEPCR